MKSQEKYPPQKNPAISEIKLWVQNFFGNFFASVGIFFRVCVRRDAPGQAVGTAVLRGQHFAVILQTFVHSGVRFWSCFHDDARMLVK